MNTTSLAHPAMILHCNKFRKGMTLEKIERIYKQDVVRRFADAATNEGVSGK